jgi:Putative Flp pilus-assembly TadE/G-like
MLSLPKPSSLTRRGHVAVVVAISLIPIVGVAALTIDGSMLFDSRRKAQAAADAAALAAATDLFTNYYKNAGADTGGKAKTSAETTATACGFTTGGGTTVTVNIPPTTGTFAGQTGYAEVIIQYPQPGYFSKIWSSGSTQVKARAVARGIYTPGSYGIIMLDPTISDSFEVDGNCVVHGDVWVNSSSSTATGLLTAGATLTCDNLNCVGGVDNSHGGVINGTINSGQSAAPDPLANIPEPSVPSKSWGNVTCKTDTTLQPGDYGTLTINAGVNVTLAPGIYSFGGSSAKWGSNGSFSEGKGGITVNTGGTITGSGVMIYNLAGDNMKFQAAGVINITPPTTGIYQGISWWQPRADTKEVHIESLNNITMPGTFYAQTGEFDFRPDGTAVYNMGNYICDQMEACQGWNGTGKSTGTVNLTPKTAAPTSRSIQLVE